MKYFDQEGKHGGQDFRNARAIPARVIERVCTRGVAFFTASFVKRVQQRLFVLEAAVEGGHRGLGAVRNLAHVNVVEVLVLQHGFGNVEQALETLVRPGLAGRPYPVQL